MDSKRFDALAKTFSTTGTRRGQLRLLAYLPLAEGLVALLGDGPEAVAKKDLERGSSHRHHRRRAGNRHQSGNDKNHRKHKQKGKRKGKGKGNGKSQTPPPSSASQPSCVPESKAQTCAGQCAQVTNTCGTPVDCGACDCEPDCGACFTCDPATGGCIVDETKIGDACGEPGQVCHTDGSCVCTRGGTTCGACRECQPTGTCTSICSGSGCCDGTTCQVGKDDDACGIAGEDCLDCADVGIGQTCGGGDPGTPGVCGCKTKTCAVDYPGQCGTFAQGCGLPDLTCSCSATTCCDKGSAQTGTCRALGTNTTCGGGGGSCVACTAPEFCAGAGTPNVCGGSDTAKPICSTVDEGNVARTAIRDTGTGLATIKVVTATNATAVVPSFDRGTTDAVVVTSTRINPDLPGAVTFEATDMAGHLNVSGCSAIF